MPQFKSLLDRQADQAKAREKTAELARRFTSQPLRTKQPVPASPPPALGLVAPVASAATSKAATPPWTQARVGTAKLPYYARTSGEAVSPQPWTIDVTNALLAGAEHGEISLFLAWPSKLTSLPLFHALANMERVFAKDLRGIRTLLFPGTHASRAPLHSVLADRKSLSDLYRSLWTSQGSGTLQLSSQTPSPAFAGALQALNDVRTHHAEVPNPSLGELVPVFVFDPAQRNWKTTVSNPLERTLAKVERLANRRDVRQKVGSEWASPDKAPGALMVVHHSARKDAWRAALAAPGLKGTGRPEVLLLDATHAAVQTNYSAVKKIPEFLIFARENVLAACGAVIVTDDPRVFFVIRAQLTEARLQFTTRVWATEGEEAILSSNPHPAEWSPAVRSNSNFSVSIVDRDASQVALTFQKLAAAAGSDESFEHQALLQACMYVLRLSNMPAGYMDLTATSTESGGTDYGSQQNAWTPVKLRLEEALMSGALNATRDQVTKAVARAESLIDAWSDATPMAGRMLAEVRKHATAGRKGVSVVLPNNRYVLLAHKFLQRKFGADWGQVEGRVEWHTLSGVGRTLSDDLRGRHFVFVGVNPDVLRILLTNQAIPHGTAVLIAYRQAESSLKTLTLMKGLEAFKPYRGRLGLLTQELERRLAEVPNPVVIERLREMSMTFKFEDGGLGAGSEQAFYKYELEGGRRAYASGWVYRHVPDDDPPFRRAAASAVEVGDFIFDMSDDLQTKVESSLQLNAKGASSIVDPVRMLLKLYHTDVQNRCALRFTSTKRSALAREIHANMVEIDPAAANCRPGRVYYWLALQAEGDTRPHAAKDSKFFKVFCKALGMDDDAADRHWGFVRNARRLNQSLGRELVARYAEILFQPESAITYRKVPASVIWELQQEALRCVFRVEKVVPPQVRSGAENQKKGTAYARAQ